MSAEILINVRPLETRVAYVEAGTLMDLKIERKTSPTLVGTIHRGIITRVLPGMQAAFVDIGLDKAAFLYVGDILTDGKDFFEDEDHHHEGAADETEDSRPSREIKTPIQDLIKEGQHLMVQVAKDPLGTKGARITTHISLPGRGVVYMPYVKHTGISRKIEDEEEKERLKKLVQKINPSGGVIVRTAAEGASEESLRTDIEYLDRLSKEIQKNYEKRKTAGQVHAELDVELRALRDMMNENVTTVWVDNVEVYKKVTKFVTQLMPKYRQNIILYEEKKPLFDLYDIDLEISRAMERKVWLKSGGYIVLDEAEALVVIDINTGRYVGKKDLEDTILKTNLEAVKEIAHQLRVRNVGGIIIIDFIDMEKQVHREQVMQALEEELRKDRSRTNIISMSELGLVEMTRKRTRPSLIKRLCQPCSYCDGKGYIKRTNTIAGEIFRELERQISLVDPNRKLGVIVHCHAEIVDWVYESESETLDSLEKRLGRSIAFKIEPSYHTEQYEIFTE
ncbi:Rne/Rng family ribonuclease [Pseudobdellovibrio exovorus]|uniref:Ribonuclease G n=1 Tax=Pseudobdellovibrio exovorus JSS TaxID=1184267 RepID=M4VE46_9BACT|nr:Rne/Rng family ribonuclease [Pseudobdellovibrio exovorus]AGH96770.1 ribonuclease G [Pseudobdellovibrio exovorus JSS]